MHASIHGASNSALQPCFSDGRQKLDVHTNWLIAQYDMRLLTAMAQILTRQGSAECWSGKQASVVLSCGF